MFTIDYKSPAPIYDQIVKSVIRMHAIGAVKSGEQLPSVRQTAVKLGVNPNTVQKAYNILESKGVIVSVAGRGSFISEEFDSKAELADEVLAELAGVIEKAKSIGVTKSQIEEQINKSFGGDAK